MIALLLLAIAPIAPNGPAGPEPCVPVASGNQQPTPSAIDEHRRLRKALGEPMPEAPTMVMLHGGGGHLVSKEYSVVVVRSADGVWRGTAVGRGRIWAEDAPYIPMDRVEWQLDRDAGSALDAATSRHCPLQRKSTAEVIAAGPPPLGSMVESVDVVTPRHPVYSFSTDEGGAGIAELIRPPK